MADNGKLQFFGQTVYPQTLSTNILNPDGTPAPVLPIPSPANVGKVPVVNATGNGYELQAQGSGGGITQSTVVAREATLPTATADSPDFVQTPDGTLYRKKAVADVSLLGTWVFNERLNIEEDALYLVSFISNELTFRKIQLNYSGVTGQQMDYVDAPGEETNVFDTRSWMDNNYKTIQITGVSALTNREEFETWLKANATKQGGGGGTVTYSYVALADLTVLYEHNISFATTSSTSGFGSLISFKFVNQVSSAYTTISSIATYFYTNYSINNMIPCAGEATLLTATGNGTLKVIASYDISQDPVYGSEYGNTTAFVLNDFVRQLN